MALPSLTPPYHPQFTELPLGIAQLRALEELRLSNNELLKIPQNFGEMAFLDSLDLSYNKLTELPDLSNLMLLEDLYLQHNSLQVKKKLPAIFYLPIFSEFF